MAYTDYLDTVEQIYIAYYQRPADPVGLVYWAQRLDLAGGDLTQIIDAFANSEEAKALYGDINEDTIGSVVDAIYQAAFNRSPDEGGKQFYVEGFKEGKFTPATIMLDILNGAQNDDKLILENKINSAMNFTKAIDPELDGKDLLATYEGNDDAQAARDFLKEVGATIDTVKDVSDAQNFIKEKIADAGDALLSSEVISGKEFTMSHDIETLQGTNSDDLFKGIVDLGTPANTTFQAGDKIIGGAGNDKVDVTIVAGRGTVTPVDISGVETISFSDVTGNNNIINAIYFKDNPTISVYNVGGETGIDNLSLDSKVVFSGIGNLAVDYFGASGTNDTVTVGLENAGVSKTAPSTLFISDTGEATDIIDTANIEHLVLETTGKNYVQLGSNAVPAGTTGVADDDTLASVKVTGDGENYIVLKDVGDGNATKANEQFTFDASEATGKVTVVDNIFTAEQTTAEITYKLGSGDDTVVFKADAANDPDFNNDKIDGGDGTDTIKFDVSAVAGAPTNGVTFTGVKDADLTNVEKIVVYNGTTTNGATIDLSNQTEGFEITGDDGVDNITGGSGVDTIDGGKGNDVLAGGKGADTLTGGAGTDTFVLDSPFNAADTITDFTSGTDKLEISLTKETVVGALGSNKFGSPNGLDINYLLAKTKATVIGYKTATASSVTTGVFAINKKVGTAVKVTSSGKKFILAGSTIKFSDATGSNNASIKVLKNGSATTVVKISQGTANLAKTGLLFFYDTDDHQLNLYGVQVKQTAATAGTLDTVKVLTHKAIAVVTMASGTLTDGDIYVF